MDVDKIKAFARKMPSMTASVVIRKPKHAAAALTFLFQHVTRVTRGRVLNARQSEKRAGV